MNGTVIDTLRYADRLKAAGVEPGQAEAMSRALNAELTEGLVTKTDLDAATAALRADLGGAIRELEQKVDAGFAAINGKFPAIDGKFDAIDGKFDAIDGRFDAIDGRFDAIDGKFDAIDAKFAAMDGRFEAMDAKFDAMDGKFGAMDGKFGAMDAKFDAMDGKFGAMDAKFEGLRSQFTSQSRHVFLILALIASLGLYNAIAPLVVGKGSQQTGPSQPVPATVERSVAPANP